MSRVFLIHGWGSGPDTDWLPWAREEIAKKGYEVIAPHMPDTEVPVIQTWVNRLTELVGKLNETDIFIGHSIGCQTILRYLERGGEGRADKIILVAPWVTLTNLDDEGMWQVADPWLKTPIDFAKVKPQANQYFAIFSDNDPWVPYDENLQFFREHLNPQLITVHNRGHITAEEGSTRLPELLQFI